MACPVCRGTGLDRKGTDVYTESREAADDRTRLDRVICRVCLGRGQIVIERAGRIHPA